MKISQATLLFFLCLILMSAHCKKDNLTPINQEVFLPAATQTGARTFGCLINGQAFIPKAHGLFSPVDLKAQLGYSGGRKYLAIYASNKNDDGSVTAIRLAADSIEINPNQMLELSENNVAGKASGAYLYFGTGQSSFSYYTDSVFTGQLTVTKYDSVKYIISGTFNFDIKDHNANTIHVTDGRFDIPYGQ